MTNMYMTYNDWYDCLVKLYQKYGFGPEPNEADCGLNKVNFKESYDEGLTPDQAYVRQTTTGMYNDYGDGPGPSTDLA